MLLTITQVAERTQMSIDGIYNLLRKNLIPGKVLLGRSVRIDQETFEAWLASGGTAWAGGWKKEADK